VPEDAPMEAMETPLREFLERTGGAAVDNLQVSTPPAFSPVGGSTTAASSHSRRTVSASRILKWNSVGESTEAESATTVLSEQGADADGGVAVSQSQGSTSFVQSSQDLGCVSSCMQRDARGPFMSGSVSIGSHGTTIGREGDHDGDGLLDSGSSVAWGAPTFRPESKHTVSSIILSESSISSDADNPLITPKKKQRCSALLLHPFLCLDLSLHVVSLQFGAVSACSGLSYSDFDDTGIVQLSQSLLVALNSG
jgi:hypothetical protein